MFLLNASFSLESFIMGNNFPERASKWKHLCWQHAVVYFIKAHNSLSTTSIIMNAGIVLNLLQLWMSLFDGNASIYAGKYLLKYMFQ